MTKETMVVGILAGGRGERSQLPLNTQKCIQEIDDGEPIIAHIFKSLQNAFGSVYLIAALAHQPEITKAIMDKFLPRSFKIQYELDNGTGSANAYRNILKAAQKNNLLIAPGDIITHPDTYTQTATAAETNKGICLSCSNQLHVAITHPLVGGKNGIINQYIWPINENSLDSSDLLRDQTIVAMPIPKDLTILLNKYPHPSMLGVFSQSVEKMEALYFEKNHLPWTHFAYPEDFQQPSPINH